MRQLRITMDEQLAVLALVEKGSFVAAGRYLGIGKSAVRKRVQSVERELRTPVFRAIGKRMVPTEAGALYILAARESVRQAFLGIDRVRALLEVQTNELRIGYSTYLNTRLLEIVRRIHPKGSESVTRESVTTQQAVTRILQGDLHAGVGILPLLDSDLFTRVLLEEPLMACLPIGHRLSTKSVIEPEDLEKDPVISIARKGLPGRHQEIVTHFESLGVLLDFAVDAYSAKEALWLVTRGIGISLMAKSTASAYRHEIVIRPLADRLLTVKSGVFMRRDHDQKHVREFVDLAWTETATLRAAAR
jgi:DNA-binding transcriptional LysR family regulator